MVTAGRGLHWVSATHFAFRLDHGINQPGSVLVLGGVPVASSPYAQALAYLYSLTDYEKQSAYIYAPERFDLRRMHRLLEALGDPHHRFDSLHIAGTKGKGSVAAMSERVLREAGYRTGLFTSPHLHTFRERIKVGGELIPEDRVVHGLDLLRPHVPSIPGLTTFELITALGFWYFAQSLIDIAVVEVGLGGRLDATNVITPLVSVITSLSYDHTAILGATLSAIAREKGGIIKPGVPVISAPQPEEALQVVEQICRERKAKLTLVGRDWLWRPKGTTWEKQSFSAWPSRESPCAACCEYEIPLLGRHQLLNATSALAVMVQLQEQGLSIPRDSISRGLRDVEWPGRLEVLGRRPWVIVDGAHNAASAGELRSALEEVFPHQRLYLVFATYRDKDIPGMLNALLPIAHEVIVTQFDSPRRATVAQLEEAFGGMGIQARRVDNVHLALDWVRQRAAPEDLICVTGSVRFTGEARAAWAQAEGQQLPPSDPPLPPSY
jgi:dihydrofolate synthase/folylpolyglutamate synthase